MSPYFPDLVISDNGYRYWSFTVLPGRDLLDKGRSTQFSSTRVERQAQQQRGSEIPERLNSL